MTGFTEEQLTVRDAIAKICSNFPDVRPLRSAQIVRQHPNIHVQDWWAEKDEKSEYPHELHAALSKDGWIGIALPEHLGGAGLGISEATMMLHTIAE